jgi:hypothetical protein
MTVPKERLGVMLGVKHMRIEDMWHGHTVNNHALRPQGTPMIAVRPSVIRGQHSALVHDGTSYLEYTVQD